MNNTYLSLGSNEGNRKQWFKNAIELLHEKCGPVKARSSVYETAAWGITTQPDFLNMSVELATTLTPIELLSEIHIIETALGRQRTIKWGPRTLDIDILLYESEVISFPGLIIPHPFMQERRFTLAPLAEIAPDYVHPVLNKTMNELLAECPDKLPVKNIGPLN